MLVYKILTEVEHARLQRDGLFTGSPADVTDGFVHLSAAGQVADTVGKHFGDAGPLVIAAADAAALGPALRWEISRGGARFPHLYRPLTVGDIAWAAPLTFDAEGRAVVPAGPVP